jgi:hypothetical protein
MLFSPAAFVRADIVNSIYCQAARDKVF